MKKTSTNNQKNHNNLQATFKIKGMHCASCANIIEKTLKKNFNINSISVNYANESATIEFNKKKLNSNEITELISPLGYSAKNKDSEVYNLSQNNHHNEHFKHHESLGNKSEKIQELQNLKKNVIISIPMALIASAMMTLEILSAYNIIPMMSENLSNFFHHLLPVMATYILFVIGKPYLTGLKRFFQYRVANMDTLIGLGTTAAFLYSFIISAFKTPLSNYLNTEITYYDITIVVIAFITLGKYLETKSKLKTGDAIEKLLNLQAKTAFVLKNGQEIEIDINQVKIGDLIIVKPGSKIAVDGIIQEGSSFIDESMISGEPMPIKKQINDTVIAGTINTTGSFMFKATKVGSETLLAQIIKMIEQAQASKAPIQALADKISAIFVPTTLIIAFIALFSWIILGTGTIGFDKAISYGITSFIGVLIIACPCALGLATPTAVIVGVGKGAKAGILIKDAATLQKLHQIDTLVIDKTGTLTEGKPTIVNIKIQESIISETELVSILATLEQKSEHPIASAIIKYAKEKNIQINEVENFEAIKGLGITGEINQRKYWAGNLKLISKLKLEINSTEIKKYTLQGKTPIIIADQNNILGFVMVADEIKKDSFKAIENLHKQNITIIMLTGDDKNTAEYIAKKLKIDNVQAELLPQDKLTVIKELQAKNAIVAMAGDGVNDAPALAQASVGIAMGNGTDVAIESAGITLLKGDISKISQAIKLSKITMTGIKQNLFWAFIYNTLGIPLAAGLFYPLFGWTLNPVFAGLAMAFSSVSVVANSLRIKSKKL